MILFAGDPHGSYSHLYPFIQEHANVSLIILGDLQLTTSDELDKLAQFCDLWFIHGNHDSKTVSAYEALWGTKWKSRNLHGKVVDIQGIKIAGLEACFVDKFGCHQINRSFLIISTIANTLLRKKFGEEVFHCVIELQSFLLILKH